MSVFKLLRGILFSSAPQRRRRLQLSPQTAVPQNLEPLEDRTLLTSDFGDAPDLGPETGPGDYTTLPEYGGPGHEASGALFMGTRPDVEALPIVDGSATGDDNGIGGRDDEDGVGSPELQLNVTAGSSPLVSVFVTNRTGQDAMLYGWIDVNGNGEFEAEERAEATIGAAESTPVLLQFDEIVPTFQGTTYARFRLGLADDLAAASPTGMAGIGEVEDYQAQISLPARTDWSSQIRDTDITTYMNLENDAGTSMAAIGDLDGNGLTEIVIGVPGDDTGGHDRGALQVLYRDVLNGFSRVDYIASGQRGLPELSDTDRFGASVAAVGDLDGNGTIDLLVGAPGDDSAGTGRGAAYLVYLGVQDGRVVVENTTKFSADTPELEELVNDQSFGSSVANAGDINGDGIDDFAIISRRDGERRVNLLFMNADQSVAGTTSFQSGTAQIPSRSDWGKKVEGLGDVNGDGVPDLAISGQSAVDIVFLNQNGSVQSSSRLGGSGFSYAFGSSLLSVGDVDGDGTPDIVVGDSQKSTLFLLNEDGTALTQNSSSQGSGTVQSMVVVTPATEMDGVELFEFLDNGNQIELRGVVYSESTFNDSGQDILSYNEFRTSNGESRSLASVGNLDGIGLHDFAAGIPGFDDYGFDAGAIQIAFRRQRGVHDTTLIASNTGGMGAIPSFSRFGTALAEAGDLNGDGFEDLYVTAPGDSFNRGAIYAIELNEEGFVEDHRKLEIRNNGLMYSELGRSIDVIGDINGDGTDDLLVSSLTFNRTGNQIQILLMDADGNGGRLIRVAKPLDAGPTWGREVAGVGDVNGDGVVDIVVSDPMQNRVDLLFMNPVSTFDVNATFQQVVSIPADELEGFGSSLASMGDMDGDGIEELAVGANDYKQFQNRFKSIKTQASLTNPSKR